MNGLVNLEWPLMLHHLLQLIIAYVFALPIGWDREAESRGVGLRFFRPLKRIAHQRNHSDG